MKRNILIQGIVGSTAYGLAREGSDVDRLGVFAYGTSDILALGYSSHDETVSLHEPSDFTLHEVGKYFRLALKCNPTLLELLWLPDELYEVVSELGRHIINTRVVFLSEGCVRDAYGGYAKQQVERLKRRTAEGKTGFSSDTQARTAKHARHCFRLLRQGRELLETGGLTVKMDDPSAYFAFDEASVDEIVKRFAVEDEIFRNTRSVLPTKPNIDWVQYLLRRIRKEYWRGL